MRAEPMMALHAVSLIALIVGAALTVAYVVLSASLGIKSRKDQKDPGDDDEQGRQSPG
jgi:hypothetical protein